MARLLSHDGVELEYEAGGDGAAVLPTRGYGATGRMWDAQRAALDDYRLITWDMRGHGRTQSPADPARYSIEATVADMRALLLHLGATRAVIGGLSVGGYASLAFYGSHPEMVRALVVCDSGPGYRNPAARDAWNARAQERARELEAGGLDALGGRSREMREAMSHHRSVQGLAHAARGMLTQTDSAVIDALPLIRVPTLIVVGERDAAFLAPGEYMAKKIPGARLEVIPGAGHASNLDRPDVTDGPKGLRWVTKTGAMLGLVNGMGSAGREYIPGQIHRSDRMASTGLYDDGKRGVRRLTDPELRLGDQDRDGVQAEVLYGILGTTRRLNDAEAAVEVMRVYNEWLADFCDAHPDRYAGLASIPNHPVEAAVEEVKRVAKRGGVRGLDVANSLDMAPLWDPLWTPLWDVVSDSRLPVHFHTVGGQRPDFDKLPPPLS